MAAVLAAVTVCAFCAPTVRAAAICGQGTYAYAGYTGASVTRGVSATIAQAGPLAVRAGHVAGWIGVVNPAREDAWLQTGMSALPGETSSSIYVEYAVPGKSPVYRTLATGIAPGQVHAFAVLEQPFDPSWWVVFVDGRPAAAPLHLPGSGRGWTAQVLGESWAGAASGVCNAYSYAFSNVRLVGTRGSTGLVGSLGADPNYLVTDRTRTGFVAAAFSASGAPDSYLSFSIPGPPANADQ